MAKNTSTSKGYRKQKKAKPFLTKKELIAAIIIIVVFIIAMIIVLNDNLLFYIFPDGNLAAGSVKQGDIVAYASKEQKTRFTKVGEVNNPEGYTCEPSLNKDNVPLSYTLKPETEKGNLSYISLSGSAVKASTLPDSYHDTIVGMGSTIEMTETIEATIQGHDAYIFSYTNQYYDSSKASAKEEPAAEEVVEEKEPATEENTEETNDPNVFQQTFTAYIDFDGTHTVCVHITCDYDDADHYLPADQVEEYTMSFMDLFTVLPAPEAK